jgi:hypothetical protein
MKEKCIICDEDIKENFLEKPFGTVVRIKKQDKNEKYYVCASCQKQHKDVKKKVEELLG